MTGRAERRQPDLPKIPPDPRTPYQRDRDRLLYAPQFRRLGAVTQVVGSHETQLFHNRLTHSLKVAQYARRIAERLRTDGDQIDPDVAEAAALAHDIGHPPFGHIAEEDLDRALLDRGVPDGFEGNAQSFRIVVTLASHTSTKRGLNLTRATLQALTKYPWERATSGKKHRKYGAYSDDQDVFNWSRVGLSHEARDRQTAEATIMDWSDDVAYALHDLEDFYAAGLVPLERLARDEDEQEFFLRRTRERWATNGTELTGDQWAGHQDSAHTLFAEFPTERRPGSLMQQLVSAKANLYASGLRISDDGKISEDQAMRRQLDLLKSLTWTYVIESPALAAQQHGQRKIVRTLLEYFAVAVETAPHALPLWAQGLAHDADSEQSRMRIACDVVASLTEAQSVVLYGQVTGARAGSVLEAAQP